MGKLALFLKFKRKLLFSIERAVNIKQEEGDDRWAVTFCVIINQGCGSGFNTYSESGSEGKEKNKI
jgi:hypothetical protein